jgi:hypothetical protein
MVADIRITDVGEKSELREYALRRLGGIVRDPRSGIEEMSLSVNRVPGPALIHDEVMADDKKLSSNAAFESGIEDLKSFIEARQAYLLARPELN